MRKLKVYLDTSVFSAYFDTRNVPRMKQTREFWRVLDNYDLYISTIVLDELNGISDEKLKKQVSDLTGKFDVMELDDESWNLADIYLEEGIIPMKELNDALHLASATCNGIDILISWNFNHLVKRKTRLMCCVD